MATFVINVPLILEKVLHLLIRFRKAFEIFRRQVFIRPEKNKRIAPIFNIILKSILRTKYLSITYMLFFINVIFYDRPIFYSPILCFYSGQGGAEHLIRHIHT